MYMLSLVFFIHFLLVSGHYRLLDPMFIVYINENDHCWKVCFGVTYDMSLWQVGNAENNETFRSELYQAENELLLWKYKQGLTRAIKHGDIMPQLNDIFLKAFGQKNQSSFNC